MKTNQRRFQDAPHVLVVEDDRSVRRMLRFSLRDAGFEITEATTGAEALRRVQEDIPDAIILDLGLPDSMGGAVLEWVRGCEGAPADCPVWVLISAQDQTDITRQYGPLGKHFLPKPFNPWELVARLQELLAAKRSPQNNQKE